MTARKNSLRVRQQKAEARLPIVSELLTKGWSVNKIHKEVSARLDIKISRDAIYQDIKKLKEQWRTETKDNIDAYMAESITRINKVIAEAFEAWEKSCKDFDEETMTQQGKPIKNGDKIDVNTTFIEKSTRRIKGRGDARYLAQILEAQDKLNRLLGLNAPERKDITSNGETIGSPLQIEIIDSREKVDTDEDTDNTDIPQDTESV